MTAGAVAALAMLTVACGGSDPAAEATAAEYVETPAITGGADSVYAVPAAREVLPAGRIYYTLTDHEWYARGEPLLHASRAHQPAGRPVAASLDEMELAGEYMGVDYYTRRQDEGELVYVPVFEGYWQAFRPDTSANGG
ncbi:MAG TPA: hypothetical protein VK936_11515 [Longimicrobiales bacterium]|nr:hypothetical protein [Longimicrobiales bacterium]